MQLNLLDLSEEADHYLRTCARIRRISCTRLMERVLKVVVDDKLILSVLDDNSSQPDVLPGENSKSHYRGELNPIVPKVRRRFKYPRRTVMND